jgi:signal peptidase I
MSGVMESEWPPPRRPRRLKLWLGLGAGVLALMVVAWGVRDVVVPHFVRPLPLRGMIIYSDMEPTLKVGRRYDVTKVTGGRYAPRRGDIVVFATPSGWNVDNSTYVGRVVGAPRQHVSCAGGHQPLVVDGTPLAEPYTRYGCGKLPYDVEVPAGRLWVLGDNRDDSYDSGTVYVATGDATKSSPATSSVLGLVKP